MDMLVFKRHDIVDGSVGRVPGRLTRPEFPAEARAEDKIEHGLVFHHFRGRDQHCHDDPCLAAIHHIVGVVAQMTSLPFGGHDRRIRIGGTDHEVGHAPIGSPNDLPVWFSHLEGPVMTPLVCLGQVLSESIFKENRKWDGDHDRGFTDRNGRHWCLAGWSGLFTDCLWRRGSRLAFGEGWPRMSCTLWLFFSPSGEEFPQMRIY